MRYKKYSYIILAILMLTVGINKTYAAYEKKCNYLSPNNEAMAKLTIKYGYSVSWMHGGKGYTEATVQKLGARIDNDTEEILNWYANYNSAVMGVKGINNGIAEANKNSTCPEFLMLTTNDNYSNYELYATNDLIEAQDFVDLYNQKDNYKAWYLTFKNEDGTEITDEEYYRGFGFAQGEDVYDPDAKITCTDLFGNVEDEDSLAYVIHEIFEYVRIIVPILIIVLGLFDFGKAVIASKVDEMKKAQLTFTKRVLIGVVVFLVPVVVDIIMGLADVLWQGMGYTICEFR